MEKIIIDDVDVSKCRYLILDSQNESNSPCSDIFKKCKCKEIKDCYYKQLQKALQENEAYKLESQEGAEIFAELKYKNKELKKENEKLKDTYRYLKRKAELHKGHSIFAKVVFDELEK